LRVTTSGLEPGEGFFNCTIELLKRFSISACGSAHRATLEQPCQ
jgi:hypothetical protein